LRVLLIGSDLLLQESLVEESDDPALVLARPCLGPADVGHPRDLPHGLGLAGRLVEVLAEVLAALTALGIDEEHWARCDALNYVLQVWWRGVVREHRRGDGDPTPHGNREQLRVPGRFRRFAH